MALETNSFTLGTSLLFSPSVFKAVVPCSPSGIKSLPRALFSFLKKADIKWDLGSSASCHHLHISTLSLSNGSTLDNITKECSVCWIWYLLQASAHSDCDSFCGRISSFWMPSSVFFGPLLLFPIRVLPELYASHEYHLSKFQ